MRVEEPLECIGAGAGENPCGGLADDPVLHLAELGVARAGVLHPE